MADFPPHVRVIEVIRVIATEGAGIAGDPKRRVFYYLTLGGEILARNDEWENEEAGKARA